MADLSVYSIAIDGSTRKAENQYLDDISSSGTLHSRKLHSKEYVRLNVIYPGMTGQEFADLKAIYTADPKATHTGITWQTDSPQTTYSAQMLSTPETVTNHGNNRFDVAVSLRGWAV